MDPVMDPVMELVVELSVNVSVDPEPATPMEVITPSLANPIKFVLGILSGILYLFAFLKNPPPSGVEQH